jgi:hypothetical protein
MFHNIHWNSAVFLWVHPFLSVSVSKTAMNTWKYNCNNYDSLIMTNSSKNRCFCHWEELVSKVCVECGNFGFMLTNWQCDELLRFCKQSWRKMRCNKWFLHSSWKIFVRGFSPLVLTNCDLSFLFSCETPWSCSHLPPLRSISNSSYGSSNLRECFRRTCEQVSRKMQ